jgi:manganese/zinc/iron transport system substrate-binding protein
MLLSAACAGCGGRPPAQPARPLVVATTTIVADLVRQVAGDRVSIETLMGPGVDPHAYRATPRDADRLARADLIVAGGLHLEGKLVDLLARLGRSKRVVLAAEAVPAADLLEAAAGVPDPHVWFDASLWCHAVEPLVGALAAIDPAGAKSYRARADSYLGRLRSLHESLLSTFAAIPDRHRVLITAHDAFSYLGRGYGIEVVGLQGVSTESEAGLADVNRIVDLVVTRGIPAVFVETSVPDRAVEAMCEGVRARGRPIRIGGRLYSDALGEPGSGADTLEGMLLANAETIRRELSAPTASAASTTLPRWQDAGSPRRQDTGSLRRQDVGLSSPEPDPSSDEARASSAEAAGAARERSR